MSTAPARILIADDQADVLSALRLLLKSEGHACVTVEGPAEALDRARRESFDAALIDLNYTRDTTSGEEGLALLAELKRASPELSIWRSGRCATALPTSSRNPGTTAVC
jgi:CheY-like chemotaxis protein